MKKNVFFLMFVLLLGVLIWPCTAYCVEQTGLTVRLNTPPAIALKTHSVEVRIISSVTSYDAPTVKSEYYLPASTYVVQAKTYYGLVPTKSPVVQENPVDLAEAVLPAVEALPVSNNEESGGTNKQAGSEAEEQPDIKKQPRLSLEVYFDFDSSALSVGEAQKINVFTALAFDSLLPIKEEQAIRKNVKLVGEASPEGPSNYNIELSKKRSLAVKEALEHIGIDVNTVEWKGDKECNTPKSRWKECRRVELSYE